MKPPLSAQQLLKETGLPGLELSGANREIIGIASDSRQTRPGFLFAALPGYRLRGDLFVQEAIRRQAVAVLDQGETPLADTLAHFIHADPRLALSRMASAFHGHPAQHMTMAAITGTNGKTTVAAMVESILHAQESRVGIIGTTGIRGPNLDRDNPLTTPDPVALHAILADLLARQCQTVVMEVSSHALEQQRTEAIAWKSACFTNLSQDHLDFHGDTQNYFQAKARLFLDRPPDWAIVNLDDPHGRELAAMLSPHSQRLSFSLSPPPVKADFRAIEIQCQREASLFTMATPRGTMPIRLPVSGRFNIANALAAAAMAWSLGVDLKTIRKGLERFKPQPGRLEPITMGQPFSLFVDFAHTPQALENILETAREMDPKARILLVFGCGGDRDAHKRPIMGEIAARLAHWVAITDDNPRSEDPGAIRSRIIQGMGDHRDHAEEIADRCKAIHRALTLAQPSDIVIIAGKGHEKIQIFQHATLPFDDRQCSILHLQSMGYTPSRTTP